MVSVQLRPELVPTRMGTTRLPTRGTSACTSAPRRGWEVAQTGGHAGGVVQVPAGHDGGVPGWPVCPPPAASTPAPPPAPRGARPVTAGPVPRIEPGGGRLPKTLN